MGPDEHLAVREGRRGVGPLVQRVVGEGFLSDIFAGLGRFQPEKSQFVVAVEGMGARDPLDLPFRGRRMSAVDQADRCAINLPCDWIVVTSMRETRLYHKGSIQHAYERFETVRLAREPALLRRCVFLLRPERVMPAARFTMAGDAG